MFVHTVYFWMNAGVTDAQRRQLVDDCKAYLSKIPTVRHLWAGRPAMTPRDVVDNSYDVGLCVALDDAAGHDVYQEHPVHDVFRETCARYWREVLIYDSVTIAG